MSTSPVTRVVDYEPPARLQSTKPVRPPDTAPDRERHLRVVRTASPPRRAASAFTDAALRTVLEVIDQRRPAAQLRPLLAGGLADTVVTLRAQNRTTAVLRRVRLQAADDHETAFEVAAVYSRGPRSHAIAGRVELTSTPRGLRWQLSALHIG
ncbi:hypothetical protein BVC93_02125 [Mycobacterium sp. MS1601]|uniref:Rv3235 family protein n=1 Tax=Mycobacterium sp. MS1601 TaxID=1936029 RepID=UPI0009797F4E|nr:Rv3235 family protein [Mycobacterium sp. MS1601]AQA06059.1 hypothetical protein BVC93_02125 [Mycobacterium sp. MS1601]